jgi:hypothetical protein
MNGHAHKAEAHRLAQEIWELVRKPGGVTGGDMPAAIVRMLRERAGAGGALARLKTDRNGTFLLDLALKISS